MHPHQQPRRSISIAVDNTVAEIQKLLSGHGATAVMVEYGQGDPVAMKFKIVVDGEGLGYRMPIDWEAVLRVMRQDRVARRYCTDA
jgi:hypothetical protein